MRILLSFLLLWTIAAKAQKYPYTLQVDAGILTREGAPSLSGQIINGIKIQQWNSEAGIAFGADVYQEFTLLPISASLKHFFMPASLINPYVSFQAGYAPGWLHNDTDESRFGGGTLISPGIGLRFKTTGRSRVNLHAAYRRQNALVRSTYLDGNGNPAIIVTDRYELGRILLSIGVSL